MDVLLWSCYLRMAFLDGDNFCKAFAGALVNMSYHSWVSIQKNYSLSNLTFSKLIFQISSTDQQRERQKERTKASLWCQLNVSYTLHIGAKCPFIFRLGLASPCWEFKCSQKTKSTALIKLVSFGIFRLIHYLHNWSLSTLKLPVQHLNSKSSFLANARIEDFNFKNEKSQVKNFYNFQLFVTFSPDSDSSAIKFFRIGC